METLGPTFTGPLDECRGQRINHVLWICAWYLLWSLHQNCSIICSVMLGLEVFGPCFPDSLASCLLVLFFPWKVLAEDHTKHEEGKEAPLLAYSSSWHSSINSRQLGLQPGALLGGLSSRSITRPGTALSGSWLPLKWSTHLSMAASPRRSQYQPQEPFRKAPMLMSYRLFLLSP